jgi:hypothetical protein
MATYKVLQDIEADDKLLGPLSLKQFIFAAIFIGLAFIQFLIATSPTPIFIKVPIITGILAPMLLFGFLAAPIGGDQPTEVWLIARLNFLFKPRKRIWNQDGISELVTITAPKREVHTYTNGLSQSEVKSRLHALANTVDSRGWAVKNVNTNLFAQPSYLVGQTGSDRLVDPSSLPQEVPAIDVSESDDILDPVHNSTAQHLEQLIQKSTSEHREQAISAMQAKKTEEAPTNYWFMNQSRPTPDMPLPSNLSMFSNQQVVAPGTVDAHPAAEETAAEHELAEKLKKERRASIEHYNEHMKTVQPLHDRDGKIIANEQPAEAPHLNPVNPFGVIPSQPMLQTDDQTQQAIPVVVDATTKPLNPAIVGLAHNDDLNVATIARQAKQISADDGEVVISLH